MDSGSMHRPQWVCTPKAGLELRSVRRPLVGRHTTGLDAGVGDHFKAPGLAAKGIVALTCFTLMLSMHTDRNPMSSSSSFSLHNPTTIDNHASYQHFPKFLDTDTLLLNTIQRKLHICALDNQIIVEYIRLPSERRFSTSFHAGMTL